jgi:hypothetical protein
VARRDVVRQVTRECSSVIRNENASLTVSARKDLGIVCAQRQPLGIAHAHDVQWVKRRSHVVALDVTPKDAAVVLIEQEGQRSGARRRLALEFRHANRCYQTDRTAGQAGSDATAPLSQLQCFLLTVHIHATPQFREGGGGAGLSFQATHHLSILID